MLVIPFSGSKRNCYNYVSDIVKKGGYTKVFEPFGGSAVLSVNLYNDGLINQAYVNDYDGLFDLYPEYLKCKEKVVKELADKGINKKIPTALNDKPLPKEHRLILQNIIKNIEPIYWRLLGNNFVFSAICNSDKELSLSDFRYLKNDITTEKQWAYLNVLNQLERVSLDYKDYFRQYKKEFDDRSLIILDPPYLNSSQKQYTNSDFFSLADTLELLELVKESNCDFIFFNMVERDTRALLKLFDFNIKEFQTKYITTCFNAEREDVIVWVTQNDLLEEQIKIGL